MSWGDIDNTEWLITGGTGSLGKRLVSKLLTIKNVKGIRIYSRDEFKQWQLKQALNESLGEVPISFLIGDIRDKERLNRACNGVTYIINAAAMKQVPACENDPFEAVKTNIRGSQNIINAAIDNNVKKVMHVSTDKAVEPINLYGATKMVAEKLFIDGNTYSPGKTKFSVCRYGNVLGSRGSIIQIIENCIKENKNVPLTHKDMTRFFVTLKTMSEFIINNILSCEGGEIFIPEMKSMKIIDLIQYFTNNIQEIGIREGEKIHETIISEDEIKNTKYFAGNQSYIIFKQYQQDTLNKAILSNSEECLLSQDSIKKYLNNLLEEKQW